MFFLFFFFFFFFNRFLEESGSNDSKWNASHRRRNRPLPLPSASSDSGVIDMADLQQLLTDLNKHPDSWPFHQPVTRAEVFFENIFLFTDLLSTQLPCPFLKKTHEINQFVINSFKRIKSSHTP